MIGLRLGSWLCCNQLLVWACLQIERQSSSKSHGRLHKHVYVATVICEWSYPCVNQNLNPSVRDTMYITTEVFTVQFITEKQQITVLCHMYNIQSINNVHNVSQDGGRTLLLGPKTWGGKIKLINWKVFRFRNFALFWAINNRNLEKFHIFWFLKPWPTPCFFLFWNAAQGTAWPALRLPLQ